MAEVESFKLDHTTVTAPYVRISKVLTGPNGDKVTVFDIRFRQPNQSRMCCKVIHTLEHLLAVNMRNHTEDIIDISPMGCLTGFYVSMFGESKVDYMKHILGEAAFDIDLAQEIPGATEKECGSYTLHNLAGAKEEVEIFKKGMGL
jgi:S-ribosylhomocysteine lyase